MNRVLLDTQVLILLSEKGIDAVPPKVQQFLEDPDIESFFSSVSITELAIKHSAGHIQHDQQKTKAEIDGLELRLLPYTPQHAYQLFTLPLHHKDPFDRMLIATALSEQIPIVSGDRQFKKYKGLEVIWK